MATQRRVFVCYSHKDKRHRDQLLRFLRPLEREGLLDWWADTRLTAGAEWRRDIAAALSTVNTAVLLISQDFLDSDFIVTNELPRLIERAAGDGLRLIPVFLSPSNVAQIGFEVPQGDCKVRLTDIQGIGSPERTLTEMRKVEREKEYLRLSEKLLAISLHVQATETPGTNRHADSGQPDGSVSETPSPQAPAQAAGHMRSLVARALANPKQAVALLGVATALLATLFVGLGYLTFRERLEILEITESVSYPMADLLYGGLSVVSTLLAHALGSLISDYPVLLYAGWASVGLIVLQWAMQHFKARRGPMLVVLLLTGILATPGMIFFAAAIKESPPCGDEANKNPLGEVDNDRLNRDLAVRASVEACTWIRNGTNPINDRRRHDLAGIGGWIVTLCFYSAWTGIRLGKQLPTLLAIPRNALLLLFLFLALWAVKEIPRGHAYAVWGIEHSQVISLKPDCAPVLETVIREGSHCCAFDVAESSSPVLLFLQGSGCPPGSQFQKIDRQCLGAKSGPRTVYECH